LSLSPDAGPPASVHARTCPACGERYDGDRCLECIARKGDIDETLITCFLIALGGAIANAIALGLYPPLEARFSIIYMIPVGSTVAALALAVVLGKQRTRYATLVRISIVFVAATWLVPAGFVFLNGILDGNPAVEVPSHVLNKYVSLGRSGGPDVVVAFSWRQQEIQETMRVDRKSYSAIEPGDYVRVMVHPGLFSQPWYSVALVPSTRDSMR
jgi:hypothetical protein